MADKLTRVAVASLEKILVEVRRVTRSNSKDLSVLARKLADMAAAIPDTPNYRQKRESLRFLLQQVRGPIKSTFAMLDERTKNFIFEAVKLESSKELRSIAGLINFDLVSAPATLLKTRVDSLMVEGLPMSEWWAKQGDDLAAKFGGVVTKALREGLTGYDIAKQIMANDAFDLIARTKGQAEALARTSTIAVLNDYKLDSYRANSDVLSGLQWIAVLDGRTTEVCRELDGLTWDLDLNPIGHSHAYPGPIAHWNCRSTQIPVIKDFAELGIEGVGTFGPETRATPGGTIDMLEPARAPIPAPSTIKTSGAGVPRVPSLPSR